ncbi:hypothetical protein CJF42_16170 [Pseudoalteromonas sp. NBT06-2]|uniref:type I-F CRISPR-associated protein Csy2 n=1 Tax=Pseudoalteromonas sp. NBT06-2 TaxID=2025950 RepID=UPI000BA6004A|nr:type I-F CRISPR-associated protein Csy2 [Pseudoalteromonas sp. NBT06-2]PAJ73371.1 hypothetical protein CJF42_16170 [Pseudoalteromonas sp. NBT06-2]
MHLNTLLDNKDFKDKQHKIRRAFAPYSKDIGVDGNELSTVIILLNLTFKKSEISDLTNPDTATELLKNTVLFDKCVNEVQWFHTHNLKYPEIRVSHQRIIAPKLDYYRGVITSESEPTLLGWSHNSAEVNHAKLFSAGFIWQNKPTNLARLLIKKELCWMDCLVKLGLTKKRLKLLCQQLTDSLPNVDFPDEVSQFSNQLMLLIGDTYCAVTPVVSHNLLVKIQQLSVEHKLRTAIVEHSRPTNVGDLATSLGGNVRVMRYLPTVFNSDEFTYKENMLKKSFKQSGCFNHKAIRSRAFTNALQVISGESDAITHKLRRKARVAALRLIREQLSDWLTPLIEWRLDYKENSNNELNQQTLEVEFLKATHSELQSLLNEFSRVLNEQFQYNKYTQRYAFHPDLMAPLKSQLKWLLTWIGKSDKYCEAPQSKIVYLYFSDLRVFDANALANPYIKGIPSLSALGGWSHNFQRKVNNILGTELTVIGTAWFIQNYNLVAGKNLPEPSILTSKRKPSTVKSSGIIDTKKCDMTMGLVLRVYIDNPERLQSALIKAAFPSKFAGGCMHPPSLYENKEWCHIYHDSNELFSKLSRLPRNGCWVYPSDKTADNLEQLADTLKLNPRLKPASLGFVALEPMKYRENAIADLHCYAEPAIGLVNCISPITVRLNGVKSFLNKAFWQLNIEKDAMLMKIAKFE